MRARRPATTSKVIEIPLDSSQAKPACDSALWHERNSLVYPNQGFGHSYFAGPPPLL